MIDLDPIIKSLREDSNISVDISFGLSKQASTLLRSRDNVEVEMGRSLVIHMLDQWTKVPGPTRPIWADLVESCGFYPYLEKEYGKLQFSNLPGELRKSAHRSRHLHGKYFHEEQFAALNVFDSGKNLIVSAPTSFGKSLLIEEIIARKKAKNIIIIQPTLALLDETRRNLKKYSEDYHLIIKTSQKYSESGGNIFLLTAERVIEYPVFPHIEVLIIDEFYKLSNSRNDERSDILNVAFSLPSHRKLKKWLEIS